MVMMSVGRAGLDLDAALLSRYKPYSGLMLVVIYMGALILVPSIAWKKFIGFFGLLISCATFVFYLIHFNAAITNFGFNPKLRMAYRSIEGKVQVLSGFPNTYFANIIIDAAEQYVIYRPPSFPELVARPAPPSSSTPKQHNQEKHDPHIYEFIDGEKATLVYGAIDRRCAPEQFRIALKNGAKTLYFTTQPPDFGWLNVYPVRPIQGFFGWIVDKRSLTTGLYQLGFACGNKEPTFFDDSYRVSKNP
jgi:hypothetical protein